MKIYASVSNTHFEASSSVLYVSVIMLLTSQAKLYNVDKIAKIPCILFKHKTFWYLGYQYTLVIENLAF